MSLSVGQMGGWKAVVWSLVLLPTTAAGVLLSYGFTVRLSLGHWPHAMSEQFDSRYAALFDGLLMCLFPGCVLSLLAAPGALCQRACWTEPHYRLRALLYLAGLVALGAAWGYLSYRGFLDWWMD